MARTEVADKEVLGHLQLIDQRLSAIEAMQARGHESFFLSEIAALCSARPACGKVMRHTFVPIGRSDLLSRTGLSESHLSEAAKQLCERKLLLQDGGRGDITYSWMSALTHLPRARVIAAIDGQDKQASADVLV
jgi:hypothetical protein